MPSRALSLVLLLLAPLTAHAGCGEPLTVCFAYGYNQLIFRGRVLKRIAPNLPAPAWGVRAPAGSSGSGGGSNIEPMDQFRFQVLEVFKGDTGPEITILGSDQMFDKGGEFLVFALPNPTTNEFVANACSLTGPVTSPRAPADLAWLRAYPSAPPDAVISGAFSMGLGGTDIPTISVSLTGPTTLNVSTAADHTYAFKDLPPGTYTVTAVLPADYTTMVGKNTATVTVAAKGCAEVDFSLSHGAHIRGPVTNDTGKPAKPPITTEPR
jgi:hypothetical protein